MTVVRRIAIAFAAVLTLLAAACEGTYRSEIAAPRAVVSPPAVGRVHDATNLEIAVGSDGAHHLIYMEEEEGGFHRIVYAYQKLAEPPRILVFQPGFGEAWYANPDIAVTQDGRVHVVWQVYTSHAPFAFFNCYANFLPTDDAAPACTSLDPVQPDGAGYALEGEPPQIVAENNTAYAVYTVFTRDDEPRHRLMAVKVWPALGTARIIHDVVHMDTSLYYHRPALAMEDNGTLHMLYTLTDDTIAPSDEAHYARLAPNGSGDNKHVATLVSSYQYEAPAIAIQHIKQAPDMVYSLLHANPRVAGSDRSVFHFYSYTADVTTLPAPYMPLDEAHQFVIPGSPALVISDGNPMAYFTGSSTLAADQVFALALTPPSTIVFLPSTAFRDCPPRAVAAQAPNPSDPSTQVFSAVVIWRECSGFTARDLYVADQTSPAALWQLRKAADHGSTNTKMDYEIAAHGDSVFAAWIDARSGSDPRLVPWISANVYQSSLPVITR